MDDSGITEDQWVSQPLENLVLHGVKNRVKVVDDILLYDMNYNDRP